MESDSEGEVHQESYEEDDADDVGYHSGGTDARDFTESEAEVETPRNKSTLRRPSKSSEKEIDPLSEVESVSSKTSKRQKSQNLSLGEALRKGRTLGRYLKPTLTESCIFFKDIRPNKPESLVKVTVTLARGVPFDKEGIFSYSLNF